MSVVDSDYSNKIRSECAISLKDIFLVYKAALTKEDLIIQH